MKKSAENSEKICPVCGGREFITTAHVVQDWKVDGKGNFIECIHGCTEVTHGPENENSWTCCRCGEEAIPADELEVDLEDIVFACNSTKTLSLNGSQIKPTKKAICFYLAIWESDGPAYSEGCNRVIGYSIYDRRKRLLDGGDMECSEEETKEMTPADMVESILKFCFEGQAKDILWKFTNLDRLEDFEE